MLLMLVLHGVSDFNSNREVLHVINLEACPKPSFNLSRVLHCGVFFSPLSLALSIYRLLVNFFFFFLVNIDHVVWLRCEGVLDLCWHLGV